MTNHPLLRHKPTLNPIQPLIPIPRASIVRLNSKPITNLHNQRVPRFVVNKVICHYLGTKFLINLKRQCHTPLIHSFPAKLYSPTAPLPDARRPTPDARRPTPENHSP